MAGRERKRADRRKRKERGLARRESFAQDYRERSESRNDAARAQLEPLAPAERPTVVTVGAVICALVAIGTVGAAIAGVKVDGKTPSAFAVAAPSILFAVMAYGMWRARYWAVLGFQAVLAFLILGAALGLTRANTARQAIATSLLVLGAGLLFWFQVKAMARIQMPTREPR
jgi:hypothetical protein